MLVLSVNYELAGGMPRVFLIVIVDVFDDCSSFAAALWTFVTGDWD